MLSMVHVFLTGLRFWSSKCSYLFLYHDWILNHFNFADARCWGLLVRWFILNKFIYWYLSQLILQCLFTWTLDFCELLFFITLIELDLLMFEFFLVEIKELFFSLEGWISGLWLLLIDLIVLSLNIKIVLHALL